MAFAVSFHELDVDTQNNILGFACGHSALEIAGVCKEYRRTAMAALGAETLFELVVAAKAQNIGEKDIEGRVKFINRAIKAKLKVELFVFMPVFSGLRKHVYEGPGGNGYTYPLEDNLTIHSKCPDKECLQFSTGMQKVGTWNKDWNPCSEGEEIEIVVIRLQSGATVMLPGKTAPAKIVTLYNNRCDWWGVNRFCRPMCVLIKK